MEFLTIENLEPVRTVIGLLIFLISVICLKQRNSEFDKVLKKKISPKKVKEIKNQIRKLKTENAKTRELLKHFNDHLTEVDPVKENQECEKPGKTRSTINMHPASGLRIISGIRERQAEHSQNPYEAVRHFVESGIAPEKIYEKLDIPKAEIDLMLKFNRLSKLSRLKNSQDHQRRACV